MIERASQRRGGRPKQAEAPQITEKILAAATDLFLTRGFGATSVEAVAARVHISKRTFYHRFRDKPALFRAVVERLIQRWLPQFDAEFHDAAPVEETLRRSAQRMLALALQPDALALRRLLLIEAERFPELVEIAIAQGAAKGIERIAALLALAARAGTLHVADPVFAAIQFQEMVLGVPLRRAMGFGARLSAAELDAWAERSVALFLHGCGARRGPP